MKNKSIFDKKVSLSLQHQQTLASQTITDNEPGSMLRDFEAVLEFIATHKIKLSPTHNLFGGETLSQLNALMSSPISIALKRPAQKSYPNINGIYLLLRASGLTQVEKISTTPYLILDQVAIASWRSLNVTERYFTLLTAWLIRGKLDILGEHQGFSSHIMECSRFLDRIPGTGLKIAGDRNTEQLLSFMPGLFNIALLELFGLVSLQHGKPAEGKGWNIHRAHRVLFGDALLSAACTLYSADDFWLDLSDDEVCNKFQSVMQNYFPEWRNNLSMLETGFRDGTFILKVAHGKVWRRIAVRGEWSLEDLSSSILQAFDFDNDHLHCFTYKTRFGSSMRVHHPYMDEPPFTSDVRIGDVPLCEGESMEYVFDFGDHWEFNVKLESVEPVDRKMKKHMVIEKHGEAPAQYGHWNDEDEEWD